MSKAGKKKKSKKTKRWRTRVWACGAARFPGEVQHEGGSVRPTMLLCVDRTDGCVLAYSLQMPDEDAGLIGVLAEAMTAPKVGAPRKPDRVLVANAREAAALVEALADPTIEVVVAPTPDIERLASDLADSMRGQGGPNGELPDIGYLEQGVSKDAMQRLFVAAKELYAHQPWHVFSETGVLCVDCEALGLDCACLSVIGAVGESMSMLLFASIDDYEAFCDSAERLAREGYQGQPDLGTSLLSLNFERARDLPPKMRKEAAKFGWPVADTDAYPWIQHRSLHGSLLPTKPRDVRVITACAQALAVYSREAEPGDAIEVEVDGVVLELSVPAVSAELEMHANDNAMVQEIVAFANRRFGEAVDEAVDRTFESTEDALMLALPWVAYELELEGRLLMDWYREAEPRLSPEALEWWERQRAAWMSLWEIVSVVPGESLVLRDLLTGHERNVYDEAASAGMPVRTVLLGRVVDMGEYSLLVGAHPRVLGPADGERVVKRMHKRLRRKTHVPVERLKGTKNTRALIRHWEDVIAEDDIRRDLPMALQNTDGDPVLNTTDRFRFDPSKMKALRGGLDGLEGMLPCGEDEESTLSRPGNAMHAHWDNTILAHIEVGEKELRVRTNSLNRADHVREILETSLGEWVTFRVRSHEDPVSLPAIAQLGAKQPHQSPSEKPPEILDALREFKAEHYASWLDQPIPALGGRTPRAAARTKEGQRAVDVLLREIEHHESALPIGERYDFGGLREVLGLRP